MIGWHSQALVEVDVTDTVPVLRNDGLSELRFQLGNSHRTANQCAND